MLYPLYALAALMRDIHSEATNPPGGFSAYNGKPDASLFTVRLPDPLYMIVDVSESGSRVTVYASYAGGARVVSRRDIVR